MKVKNAISYFRNQLPGRSVHQRRPTTNDKATARLESPTHCQGSSYKDWGREKPFHCESWGESVTSPRNKYAWSIQVWRSINDPSLKDDIGSNSAFGILHEHKMTYNKSVVCILRCSQRLKTRIFIWTLFFIPERSMIALQWGQRPWKQQGLHLPRKGEVAN